MRHRIVKRLAVIGLTIALPGALTGCVSRRMTIASNPPGALVLVEGREVGYTPVSLDFTYYGTREFTLIKDGYETLTVQQPVRPPWYQWPVIEFFADNFTPGHVTDRRHFAYQMQPQRLVPNQELLQRGEMLRGEARMGP
jgi:hypothetical protein